MKYEITHSCGHVETVQLYGTNVHGERDAQAARLEAVPCAHCKATAPASEAEERANLVSLTGSDKQVAWARDIRESAVVSLLDRIAADPSANDAQKLWMASLLSEAANMHGSASWWIENKPAAPAIFREMGALAQASK